MEQRLDAGAEHHYLTMDDLTALNERLAALELSQRLAIDPPESEPEAEPESEEEETPESTPEEEAPIEPPTPNGETTLDEHPAAELPSDGARQSAGPLF